MISESMRVCVWMIRIIDTMKGKVQLFHDGLMGETKKKVGEDGYHIFNTAAADNDTFALHAQGFSFF